MANQREEHDKLNPKNNNSAENNQQESSEMISPILLETDLEKYVESVEELAIEHDDLVFNNTSHKHAAIVVSMMLKYGEGEFCIYDSNLSGDIANQYEGFYPALEQFVTNGNSVKILIDNDSNMDNFLVSRLSELKKLSKGKVELRKVNKKFQDAIQFKYKKQINFAVCNSKAVRVEEVDKSIKELDRKAFCSFNRSDIAAPLYNIFSSEYGNCEPVAL
jgi:hypothetical protein